MLRASPNPPKAALAPRAATKKDKRVAEVRFPTPDVALVHATWDVTGWSRPTGEAVPVLKEITTMAMVKTDGKWLITAFQNTERWGSTK